MWKIYILSIDIYMLNVIASSLLNFIHSDIEGK